ncbi:MAG: zinc ribbon domain-containing protein [Firmicutes bacterium]|nr:zinc ribbon domain-containing protein [Clostridia bacterium]MBQ5959703.1 zinc ribbon domain-containing protein [Bacillota bacterium]
MFCGSCGDIFSRVVWNIHGRKQIVWWCSTRMQDGTETCHCRTINEEMLQRITVNVINRAHRMSMDAVGRVAECVDEALNESLLEQAAAIDEKIKTLQIELIGYRADSPDADRIGTEILTLRDEKENILSQSTLQAQRTNEIRELASFFEGLSGPVITFDESYVRRLFSRITIFDEKVVFSFKDGKEVTIKE